MPVPACNRLSLDGRGGVRRQGHQNRRGAAGGLGASIYIWARSNFRTRIRACASSRERPVAIHRGVAAGLRPRPPVPELGPARRRMAESARSAHMHARTPRGGSS